MSKPTIPPTLYEALAKRVGRCEQYIDCLLQGHVETAAALRLNRQIKSMDAPQPQQPATAGELAERVCAELDRLVTVMSEAGTADCYVGRKWIERSKEIVRRALAGVREPE